MASCSRCSILQPPLAYHPSLLRPKKDSRSIEQIFLSDKSLCKWGKPRHTTNHKPSRCIHFHFPCVKHPRVSGREHSVRIRASVAKLYAGLKNGRHIDSPTRNEY